jgi:hypothetical protein
LVASRLKSLIPTSPQWMKISRLFELRISKMSIMPDSDKL